MTALPCAGVDVLEQVADRPRLDRLAHARLALLDGEDHHPGAGHDPHDLLGGADTAEPRHAHVHQHHVGPL
jgi:hypothetical protein